MNIWFLIGLLLLGWAVYDIFTGTVWIHRKVIRSTEPFLYWVCIGLYGLLGVWCLLPY